MEKGIIVKHTYTIIYSKREEERTMVMKDVFARFWFGYNYINILGAIVPDATGMVSKIHMPADGELFEIYRDDAIPRPWVNKL